MHASALKTLALRSTTPARTPLVLLVDDTPTNLDILVDQLTQEDIDVRVALSGEEGVHLARQLRPDLILLDVMMPGLDGYQVCSLLKQDPELLDIPVVFLTAKDGETEVEQGFNLGGVDYIHKPFSLPILKARVRSHLALKRKADLLEALACTDGLTQIANRRQFDLCLQQEWDRSERNQQTLSAILLDVDFFKQYNDHNGHGAGDQCLQAIALALSAQLQRAGDLVARYGGEEFVVLLPDTNFEGALKVAEKLRIAVENLAIPTQPQAKDRVTMSLGVATTSGAQSPSELLSEADRQLYIAKQQGRNRVAGRALST